MISMKLQIQECIQLKGAELLGMELVGITKLRCHYISRQSRALLELTVPSKLRSKLGLKPGREFAVYLDRSGSGFKLIYQPLDSG